MKAIISSSPATFDNRTRTARWENTLTFGFHEFVAGAEYTEDQVTGRDSNEFFGFDSFEVDSRDNTAIFAQALLDFSPVAVQASLRHDDNETFGDEMTGSLALGYDLDANHTLRSSYATAFKAPSFNELFFPGFGNPELEAETSETVEVGMRGQYRHVFWDLAAYQTDVDNLIAFTEQGGLLAPFNVDKARIRGVELATGVDIDDWILQAALTWLDPENRSDDDDNRGNRLPRRASQSLRLDVDRELGDWSLGGSWIVQNHRYNGAGNEERLPGFGLVNLRAGWQFAPLWSARLTVENVLDKEYATAKDFSGNDFINAGRAAFLSVQFGG